MIHIRLTKIQILLDSKSQIVDKFLRELANMKNNFDFYN